MSQKPFMWDRNNPYEYSDPSGYNPIADGAMAALNWYVLDDVRTALDKRQSTPARVIATAMVIASIAPEGKVPAKVVGSIIKGFTKHGLERAIERPGGAASERAILDAARNPVEKRLGVVDAQGRVSDQYVGKDAQFSVNSKGQVITSNALSEAGKRAPNANVPK
jgi:hypothetical protein